MERHCVVPDVIPIAPREVATIKYGNLVLESGNELTPFHVKNAPDVLKWSANDNSLYTLCMTSPDVPSRADPTYREWQHWLVVNIPGDDISKGQTLSEYIGSGPPKGTGLHRYVFLIYKQVGKMETAFMRTLNEGTGDHRGMFSIHRFAQAHHMGLPVAGNFYQAQWDDYVPILYPHLRGKSRYAIPLTEIESPLYSPICSEVRIHIKSPKESPICRKIESEVKIEGYNPPCFKPYP